MHGKSIATAFLAWESQFGHALTGVERVPFPTTDNTNAVLERLAEILRRRQTAAVFLEAIQDSGGGASVTGDFCRALRTLCTETETQAGTQGDIPSKAALTAAKRPIDSWTTWGAGRSCFLYPARWFGKLRAISVCSRLPQAPASFFLGHCSPPLPLRGAVDGAQFLRDRHRPRFQLGDVGEQIAAAIPHTVLTCANIFGADAGLAVFFELAAGAAEQGGGFGLAEQCLRIEARVVGGQSCHGSAPIE